MLDSLKIYFAYRTGFFKKTQTIYFDSAYAGCK
jgi:hypothetical protein